MSPIPKNKHDVILQAALEQFSENGFHSSPVSQLATLAGLVSGVSIATLKIKMN